MKLKSNPRQAHSSGITKVLYSLDGKYLFSVGSNDLIRKFVCNSNEEPDTLDHHHDSVLDITCSDSQFASCSEDGTVHLFDLNDNKSNGVVVRNPLAIREVKFSPDGKWLGICGEDKYIKLINKSDIMEVSEINLPVAVKHIAWDVNGEMISASGMDGVLRFYKVERGSIGEGEEGGEGVDDDNPFVDGNIPKCKLIKTLDGVTPSIKDISDFRSSKVSFHPDNKYFAAPTKTFEISLYSKDNWLEERRFRSGNGGGHQNSITDLLWSPNGKYLITCGLDNKVIIWDSKTFLVVDELEVESPISLTWHPELAEVTVANEKGQIITLEGIPGDGNKGDVYRLEVRKAVSVKATEKVNGKVNGNSGDHNGIANGQSNKNDDSLPKRIRDYDDYDLDLELTGDNTNEDWIVDDDGAGYVGEKRDREEDEEEEGDNHSNGNGIKRMKPSSPVFTIPDSFISGSTPWKNNKRYLCLNTIGYIWSVSHETYNQITVTFFDKGAHKEYHFSDYNQYDLACLTNDACLFANKKDGKVLLRFHNGFTNNWEYSVSESDSIRSISLSNSIITICTENGYVRTFNRFGTPLSVYRQSRDPVITSSSWKNYLFIIRSNALGQLTYSIENIITNIVYQKNDVVDIGINNKLISAFFTNFGDPCIYDSNGILLVLQNWRDPLQTKWVPIIDSKSLNDSNKQETYWPIGVVDNRFICTIIRGVEKYPILPLPVTTEFDLNVPVDPSTNQHEQQFLTQKLILELSKSQEESDDNIELPSSIPAQELELDKMTLRLIQASCIESKPSKALALSYFIHREEALEAASKVALRFDQPNLAEKINDLLNRKRLAQE